VALEAARQARRGLDQGREQFSAAERKAGEIAARRSALSEAIGRLGQTIAEASGPGDGPERGRCGDLLASNELETMLLKARVALGEQRIAASDARARVQTLAREADLRSRRRAAIAGDIKAWQERSATSLQTAQETGAASRPSAPSRRRCWTHPTRS
jgi:chromosome segregation protein